MRRPGSAVLASAALLALVVVVLMMPGTREERPANSSFGFKDWLVQCQAGVCTMSQQILDQRSRQGVLQLHLGHQPGKKEYQLLVIAPLGVSVPHGVQVHAGDFKRAGSYTQCLPGGCLAPLAANEALLEAFKKGDTGRAVFADRANKVVEVPFSTKGFAAAFEKMESESGAAADGTTWWTRFWNSSRTD